MNPESCLLFSRREALRQTVIASLGLSGVLFASTQAVPAYESEYVMENDYPFFGPEPEPALSLVDIRNEKSRNPATPAL